MSVMGDAVWSLSSPDEVIAVRRACARDGFWEAVLVDAGTGAVRAGSALALSADEAVRHADSMAAVLLSTGRDAVQVV